MKSSTRSLRFIAVLIFISILAVAFPFTATAQIAPPANEEQRKKLEQELVKVEQEIFEQRKVLYGKQQEGKSIERDIDLLNAEIKKAQLTIRQKNLTIGKLASEMEERQQVIDELSAKINREKTSLADLVRKTSEVDNFSLVEVMLASASMSKFFEDADNYSSVKVALNDSLSEIRAMQDELNNEKRELEDERKREADAKYEIEQQKKQVEAKEAEKQDLLDANKTEQKTYEELIAERLKKANEIRAALFNLRDAGPIQFGDALKYAEEASAATGVRAAFILGILKQESNLGANVGQCYMTDPATGSGIRKTTGAYQDRVMHPTRDAPIFLEVASELGFDYKSQVVSCPFSYGYGGAMGPSQFIPSTWKAYKGKVATALGVSVANPWEPRHAFMATGLFLRDLGAGAGGYSAEREAAARYYAGGNWQSLGLGYADSVLRHAETIQTTMIDPIKAANGQ